VKRIRVLHVEPDLRPGAQRFVFEVAKHVDLEQFEFVVACLLDLDEAEGKPAPANTNIEVVRLHHASGWRGLLTFIRLVVLMRRRRIDIVHTHSFLDRLFAHPAALLTGIPVVHTLNNTYESMHDLRRRNSRMERAVLWVRHSFRKLLEGRVVKQYIAISQAVYDSYAPVVPHALTRITLVYYGVPIGELAQSTWGDALVRLRADLGLKSSHPVLINVARLAIAQKDQLTLLRAMPIVLKECPDARLLLVGEGKDRAAVEQEIETLGIGRKVSVLGSREDINDLMGLSDILVFPSRFEGFGIAVTEAMAAGKPVVASRVPPITELVEEGGSGFLVEPANPQAFASAIVRLAKDRGLAEAMGLRGRQIAQAKFDVARCAAGWQDVYRTILHADRSRSGGSQHGMATG
jgi:glycosyltransferase involved in cell wall biosynthesis